MTDESGVAKVFMHGRSQAVRLPKAFRLESNEVRVRREGHRLILEPIATDVGSWFARLDAYPDAFMEKGRDQPSMPDDRRPLED